MAARRTTAPLVVLVVVLVVALAGRCGSGSQLQPVTGIDELTIPAPSLDPADFVDVVDNPWVGLSDGTRTFTLGGAVTGTRTVAVGRGPLVGGIVTTRATTTERESEGTVLAAWSDLYAQDLRGNVWWLGREGEWQAGTDGAEAGLLMAADPRLGDGYVTARTPSGDVRATVVSADAEVRSPTATYDGTVVVDTTEPGGRVQRVYYARDVGPVYEATQAGSPTYVVELTQ